MVIKLFYKVKIGVSMKLKMSKNQIRFMFALGLFGLSLPVLFIVSMYLISRNTGFEGPRGGPQDAFRHTYTSALVAKYLSPSLVVIATKISESNLDSSYDLMDIHNNNLGIQIALGHLSDGDVYDQTSLYSKVYEKVKNAKVAATDKNTVHILEPSKWQSSDLF